MADQRAERAGDGLPEPPPFRRQVFYIPGYDPFPPRRYRELYRTESVSQAAISGFDIAIAPGAGGVGWTVRSLIEGRRAEARFQVLVWSDLVQGSMAGGIAATYLQLLRTAWVYLSTGTLFRLMRLRKGPMIAALYPVLMLGAQVLVALVVAWGVTKGFAGLWPGFTGEGLGLLAGLVAGGLVLRGFRAIDHRLYAHYLMHDYAYTASDRGANPPALEARMAEFRAVIEAALAQECDEILVVGHSSGAHLAVSILADLLRGQPRRGGAVLAFLSLGQVVPMVSFLPAATRLRADLAFLAAQTGMAWVDVSAPGDGCAFALCDPVAVTGVAPPGKRWPLVLSAAFTRTLSPERWKALRWRFFRLHFQYLCAFDRPGDYDYFRVTAGGLTLADRFAGRAPSQSRIETPVSSYRNVA